MTIYQTRDQKLAARRDLPRIAGHRHAGSGNLENRIALHENVRRGCRVIRGVQKHAAANNDVG
jgi:hypothetical protein